MAEPQFTVTSGADRLSSRDQIAQTLERDAQRGEGTRLRIPVTLYDYVGGRTYLALRDTAWNLTLPHGTTVEQVELLIEAIGKCIVAVGEQGPALVLMKLESELVDPQAEARP